jgi:transcriptional regulator with XRE-family HTH domain
MPVKTLISKDLGERIHRLRFENKLSLESFGALIGLGKSTLSQIEKGDRGLTTDRISAITENFPTLNIDWLKTGIGSMYLSLPKIEIIHPNSDVTVSAPPMEIIRPVRYEFNCILVDNIASAGSVSFSDIGTSKGTPTFIPNLPKRPTPYIMLAVSGRSMEPDFHDGDFVVCYELRDQSQVMADTVHIVTSSEGIYLKEVRYLNERSNDPNAGLLRLKSLNERYEPVYLDPKESNVKLYRVVTVLHMV